MSSRSFKNGAGAGHLPDPPTSPTVLIALDMLAKIRAVTRDRHVVKASIRDLTGNSVPHDNPTHPKPVLRRTAFGHLFQSTGVVKAAEMMAPIPVSQNAVLYQGCESLGIMKQPRATGMFTIREGERVVRKKGGKVRFQLPGDGDDCASPSSSSSSTSKLIPAPLNLAPRPKHNIEAVHDCRNESPTNCCMTAQLVDYGRPDSETLAEPANIVTVSSGACGSWLNVDADDVWMQIARNC
jgi:hypothetical protein